MLVLGYCVGCGDGTSGGNVSAGPSKTTEGKGSATAKDTASAAGEGPAEFKQYNAGADLLKLPSKAGEMCPSPGLRVLSKTKMIACTDGKPAEEHQCKGPKGVTLDSGGIIPSCDISKNAAGEPCNFLVANSGCDGKQRIFCDVDLAKPDAAAKVTIKSCAKNCVMKKEGETETAECEGEEP